MERYTTTGWGLCAEPQKLSDDGFVALVECGSECSDSQSSGRTGRLAHLKHEVFTEDKQPYVFVEPGVIEQLQVMTAH